MSPQGANQYNHSKTKSKSLGKIGEPLPHDRLQSMRKNSQASRQKMMLGPDKQ